MILAAAVMASACIAVGGERIRAADLVAAVPAFAALPPEASLGYAPAPGARRMLNPRELERLAGQHGIPLGGAPSLCVERAVERLTEERVLAALHRALGSSEARVELLDFSRAPAPHGEIEFARSGLVAPLGDPRTPVVWRGRLRYADNRSLPVWARVRVTVTCKRLVAAESLPAERPIQASQVRVETAERSPFTEAGMGSFEQIGDRVPRRPIRAGEPLSAKMLTAPLAVARGETVKVEVSSGGAQLSLPARAETAGRAGDTILLRNPESGRRFPARVEGRGKVRVDAKEIAPVGAAVPAGTRGGSR